MRWKPGSRFSSARASRQGVGAREVGVAVGADDEDAHPRQLAGEVLEQEERRLVGPVEVVEHDDQAACVGRGGADEGRVGVEEPELGRSGSSIGPGSAKFGASCRSSGKMRTSSPADGSHVGLRARRGRWWRRRRGPPGPRASRRRAGGLVGAAPEHLGAAHAGVGLQLLGRARLADARLAHQHHERSRARRRPRRRPCAAAPAPCPRPTNTPRASRSSGFAFESECDGDFCAGSTFARARQRPRRRRRGGRRDLREQVRGSAPRGPAGSARCARRAPPAAC